MTLKDEKTRSANCNRTSQVRLLQPTCPKYGSRELQKSVELRAEDYVILHRGQVGNGFLMLQGLLEDDLGRRFAGVPVPIRTLDGTFRI
jgi:hypothetical protein